MKTLLLLLLVAAGCSAKDPTSSSDGVTGTYSLQSVDGMQLPATVAAFGGPGGQDLITSGTFIIKPDRTWTMDFKATSSGRADNVPTREGFYAGTWTQEGNALTLQPSEPNPWTGTTASVSGSHVTYIERGHDFIFAK